MEGKSQLKLLNQVFSKLKQSEASFQLDKQELEDLKNLLFSVSTLDQLSLNDTLV